MKQPIFTALFLLIFSCGFSQVDNSSESTDSETENTPKFFKHIPDGYFPTKYYKFDLRYLFKYNRYEHVRTGVGGVTTEEFSKRFRISNYVVYGFGDHRWKFNFTGSVLLNQPTETWLNAYYTDDLTETGSSPYLTDKRTFRVFQPRLFNIDRFHHHITKAVSIDHNFSTKLSSQIEFSDNRVWPTFDYIYINDGVEYDRYNLSLAKLAFQWTPASEKVQEQKNGPFKIKPGFPIIDVQLTKSFTDVLEGDFDFFKIDTRFAHQFNYNNSSTTEIFTRTGLALGDVPITHLYHAYPNNLNKPEIFQRFSVAGINSFETMYFNEFFVDRYASLQIKHYFKPFDWGKKFKPQLVLISRMAIGNMSDQEKHQLISFSTFNKGYSEAGMEINKILFGFGLSAAYRYGAYHLPEFQQNFAFKFTFNMKI